MAVTPELHTRLLALNREAFAAGGDEVAYHALYAAFHCALDLQAPLLLDEVAQIATEQMTWIDDRVPDHALASGSARRHGHQNIYGLLARQATTHARLLARTRLREG